MGQEVLDAFWKSNDRIYNENTLLYHLSLIHISWAAVFRGENSCPRLLLTGGNMTGCEGAEIQA